MCRYEVVLVTLRGDCYFTFLPRRTEWNDADRFGGSDAFYRYCAVATSSSPERDTYSLDVHL